MMTLLFLFCVLCIILPRTAAADGISHVSMGVGEKTWMDATSACEKKNETMFSLDDRNCTVIGQFPENPSSDFVWTGEYISTEHLSLYKPLARKPPTDCWFVQRTSKLKFFNSHCSHKLKSACRTQNKVVCLEYISVYGSKSVYSIGNEPKRINITIIEDNGNCDGNYNIEKGFLVVNSWCEGKFNICYAEELNIAIENDKRAWSDAASDCAAIEGSYLVDKKALEYKYINPHLFPFDELIWIGEYRIWNHIRDQDSLPRYTPNRCLACLRTKSGWQPTEETNCKRLGTFFCQREKILEMTTETTITQQTITLDSHVSRRYLNEFSNTDGQNSTNDDFNTAYIIIGVMIPVGIICIIVLVVVLTRNRKKSKRKRDEVPVSFQHGQAMDCTLGGGTTKDKQLTTEHETNNQHCLQVDSTCSAIPSPVYNVPVDATNDMNYDVIPAEREPESTSCSESCLPPSPFYNLPDDNINENVYKEVEDDARSQHKRPKPRKELSPPSPFYSNVDSENRLAVSCKGQSPPSPIYNNVEDANDNVYYSQINKNNRSLPNASPSLAQKREPSNVNERNVTCQVPQSSYNNCEGVSQSHSADDYNRLNEVTKPKRGNVNPYDHLFFSDDSYDKVQFKPSADHADSYGYSKWE